MRPDRLPRKEERALEARKSIVFEAKANMIRSPFDSFVAKTIEAKIDQKLTSPHLLIGGLAVAILSCRGSKDIDLIAITTRG